MMTRREYLACLSLLNMEAQSSEKSFGVRLLMDVVRNKPGKNVFLSPISVFVALEMAERGSAGTTLAAMRKVLGAGESFKAIAGLTIANALWADRHFPLRADYVKLCQAEFDAQAASLDFADPKAAAEINAWVKAKTNGKIPSIVTPDVVKKAAVILTNAVYFAAKWKASFSANETKDGVFHLASGTKTVPMMHRSRIVGAYRKGANFDAAMLSYDQSSVYFAALLPEAGKTPLDVIGTMGPIEKLTDGPAEFDLDLTLPRFTLDDSAELSKPLKRMGMDVAFHYPQADFTPMGSKEFFISEVLHKTRLEVDEEGTVAAAATAVIMRAGSAMPVRRPVKTLVFDRPFVVLIGDSQTGTILFGGVVQEP